MAVVPATAQGGNKPCGYKPAGFIQHEILHLRATNVCWVKRQAGLGRSAEAGSRCRPVNTDPLGTGQPLICWSLPPVLRGSGSPGVVDPLWCHARCPGGEGYRESAWLALRCGMPRSRMKRLSTGWVSRKATGKPFTLRSQRLMGNLAICVQTLKHEGAIMVGR